MKTIKAAVAVILVQAALCAAAYAEAARPIAVDIRVEAGAGALAAKSAEISEALLSGRNADADQLLADLYSGGIRKEEPAPVQAAAGCHCCQPAPAAAVAVSTAPAAAVPAAAPAAVAADPFANDPIDQLIRDEEAKKKEAAAKAKEKKEEAEDKAKAQKAFNWGVTIMTIALLLLLIL